ncbi:hypothetical protein ABB37_00646 [Leptomonas pyrrhocoris]|uniref:Uncharacterized protein n=1 Tax=Leptomonas pyrrhocoris TaxID=157538 RepID=A0A0N0VI35_LEPPY|nr:hypothetical protein ABB37_00646 [Leptomonas pyrrhocoris]KPA86498.1 hypothetical protein ABB37_00646 [Leptomonas pyrrhocoris]|eukprot:XP_015664937.1 hypothetical protein ABB37_00646 [Leptomonas pyrrhocoris]
MRRAAIGCCCGGIATALSAVSTAAAPSPTTTLRRWQTRVPNKGYRKQATDIPDRIRDAMALFGADMSNITSEEDPPYVPEQQRRQMLQEVMSSTQNTMQLSKMDRLRTALDAVRNEPPGDDKWQEVYMFLRTTEMSTEVIRNESDVFPKAQKLWIEMELCEEKRVPALLKLPNGMPVLPIFTMEEYYDHYLGRTEAFESCWFPVPRAGSQWEEFCKLPFPVCVTGGIQHFSMLATVALGGPQLGILVNPGQRSSKFITYPEMVTLTQMKRQKSKDRNLSLKTPSADGGASDWVFDVHLMTTFDTTKMPLVRLEPQDLPALLKDRPPIPPVAQLELQLLLYKYDAIQSVYIRTVDRPKWRTIFGASEKMTQIDVVCDPANKPDKEFFAHLQRWSFMKEFNSDVHVELASASPTRDGSSNSFMCVFSQQDAALLRSTTTFRGRTLADELDFNAPISDAQGNKPYEHHVSYH